MIQLDFDAADAREALAGSPATVGYSSHEGAERAVWGKDESSRSSTALTPSSTPAAGSHANKYTEALYLGLERRGRSRLRRHPRARTTSCARP